MDRDVTCRSLLYHYTSPAGLNGIVTSGSIRATYADFLNDAREIWYGPELCTACRLRPADRDRSRRFHRDTLGLAVCREFADHDDPGLVFFLGGGYLEVSGVGDGTAARNLALWIQVRDLAAEHQPLQAAGVEILRAPEREPWGLLEMWIADPMGTHLSG